MYIHVHILYVHLHVLAPPIQEVKAFNMMLGRLLNAGYVSQARELAALFEHDSPDMTIVMVRIQCYMY